MNKEILSAERPEQIWKKEALWRTENREWLSIAGAVSITFFETYGIGEDARNKVKELLGCDEQTIDEIMNCKHDFTLSEIHKLISVDKFANLMSEYILWNNTKNNKDAIS